MNEKDFVEILRKIRKEMHEISNSLMTLSGRAELARKGDVDRLNKMREVAEREVEKISVCVNNVYLLTENAIKEIETDDKEEENTDM